MWEAGVRKSKPGWTRFCREVREAACDNYNIAYRHVTGHDFDERAHLKRKRGCKGDEVLREASSTFEAGHTRNGQLLLQPRSITKEQYERLIDRFFPRWIATRHCPSKPRKKIVNLTHGELQELAALLATPIQKDGNMKRFQKYGRSRS